MAHEIFFRAALARAATVAVDVEVARAATLQLKLKWQLTWTPR
jgi:hypothetical protein